MNITPDQVAQFLREHPEFFAGHAELLTQLTVPNPYSGQAVSLAERQLQVLREKAATLEDRMRELVRNAEDNNAIVAKVHELGLALLRAQNLDAALQAVYYAMRERFSVPHTAIRLWGAVSTPDIPEFAPVDDAAVPLSELPRPYCGTVVPDGVKTWCGDPERLRSFAVLPLHEGELRGAILLASEDPRRFYPEMGTLYLSWMAALIGAAIERRL